MIDASAAVRRLGGSQRNLEATLPAPKTGKAIGLQRGDPSFATPEYIVQAAIQAMRDGYTHYPS
ncbi:MAG: aspartate transaminase, partial [Chloroflexota bacterium]